MDPNITSAFSGKFLLNVSAQFRPISMKAETMDNIQRKNCNEADRDNLAAWYCGQTPHKNNLSVETSTLG